MPQFFWSTYFRAPACALVFVLGYLVSLTFPIVSEWSNGRLVLAVLSEVANGYFENVSEPKFAYALACVIVSSATGIALVFLVLHVLFIRLSLWLAQRPIAITNSKKEFKENFESIRQFLLEDPLIGFAWDEYSKTCVRSGKETDPVYSMVRSQTLLNVGLARERLTGLKLLPTIPGYFVGIGLLLTFIGLVIALSKAASGTSSNAASMTASLQQLLNAATFKFSTSIAGLFSSIALSMLFRLYLINVESGFDNLCRQVESRVFYLAPQYITYRAYGIEQEQLHQLREINDVQFFQRFGHAAGPALKSAVENAIAPLATKLDNTVDKLDNANRIGIEGLVDRFTESVQGTAGKELRELAHVLGEMKETLQTVQGRLSGSGEDFSRRMIDLADNFGRLISESGSQFAAAKANVSQDMANVGREAATAVQEALREVLARVGTQMGSFQSALADFQEQMGRETQLVATKSREATEAATAAATKAAVDSADGIRTGLTGVVAELRADVERISMALKSSEAALNAQAQSVREATGESNAAASAFGRVAAEVSSAASPLLQASERIARATETMSKSIGTAVQSLSASHVAARELAERLSSHHRQIETVWENYQRQFGAVDESLSKAVQSLAEETTKQQENIARFVREVDDGCAKAITSLQGIANTFAQNTEDLGETFEDFLAKFPPTASA